MMTIDDWMGCYRDAWKGEIVPEAFMHPAKFSRSLIRRIYEHAVSEGWLHDGDSVIDPFGGVALGALDALRLGLNWIGVELEPRFVNLGRQNITAWNARYAGKLPRWGTAQLIQGDSRNLTQLIVRADAVVSSPPYSDGCAHTGGNDHHPEYVSGGEYHGVGITGAISSPPYADSMERVGGIDPQESRFKGGPNSQMNNSDTSYGSTPGQLGAMPVGNINAAISSPPYIDSLRGEKNGIDWSKATDNGKPRNMAVEPGFLARESHGHGYGSIPGQLGAMRVGDFDAAISSPPWLETRGGTKPINGDEALAARHAAGNLNVGIGNDARQLTNDTDFWSASHIIISQIYNLLSPGGYVIWVVKDFVKNKKRVPFCDQWRELCESVGFIALHEHHAWVVEQKGIALTLQGEAIERTVERKSFFRRLAEKKGSPRIDWETVLCMEKPLPDGAV